MQVIKDREIILSDWQYDLLNELSELGPRSLIPYQRWLLLPPAERICVQAIALQPEDELDFSHANLFKLKVIAMVFPSFHEGRGYTQATLLRQKGYRGELRAIGAYRDNLILMEQCGFDTFDLVETEDMHQALSAFSELDAGHYVIERTLVQQ